MSCDKKRYEDLKFAKDWEIDEESQAATHKSGLRIKVDSKFIISARTGKRQVSLRYLTDWQENLRGQGKSEEEITKELNVLRSQYKELLSRMPETKEDQLFESKKKMIEKNKEAYQNCVENKSKWQRVSNLWKPIANIFKKSTER